MSETRAATGRRSRRAHGATDAGPSGGTAYRRLVNPFEPIRLLSDDQVEALHAAALDLLQETGMRVLHAEARDILRRDGAAVDSATHMVKLDPLQVRRALACAPRDF